MEFPRWPKSPNVPEEDIQPFAVVNSCCESLVVEGDYEEPLHVLFDKKIERHTTNWDIIGGDGVTQTHPEPTQSVPLKFKGGRGETIKRVFGRDIFEAINNNPARIKELVEGKHRTNLCEMIITDKGATIRLDLELFRAVTIAQNIMT